MPKGVYEHKPLSKKTKQKIREKLEGRKQTEEHKEKLKDNYKKHKLDCLCFICKSKRGELFHTEESKRKISKKMSGEKNPMYGRTGKKCPNWKGGSHPYWQELSRKVWEKHHGRKIPKGHIIHHKDDNYKNINPKNLELIASNPRHIKWHAALRRLNKRTQEFLRR